MNRLGSFSVSNCHVLGQGCVHAVPPSLPFSLDAHQDLDCHIQGGSSTNSKSANNSPAPEPENVSSSSPDESRSSGGRFRFVVCFKEKRKRHVSDEIIYSYHVA